MVFKLFKNKDQFGVYEFLKDVKELQNFVAKKQSKNNSVSIDDVVKIITDVKELYARAKKIELSIKNSVAKDVKDKNKEFMLKVMIDKIKELKALYDKVVEYEKQLKDYNDISNVKKKVKNE
jgi:hypothetical protein